MTFIKTFEENSAISLDNAVNEWLNKMQDCEFYRDSRSGEYDPDRDYDTDDIGFEITDITRYRRDGIFVCYITYNVDGRKVSFDSLKEKMK